MGNRALWTPTTEKELLEIEHLLYTTGQNFTQIGRRVGRSPNLVLSVNAGCGVRIKNGNGWAPNPDYVPPNRHWRPYVDC